MRTALLQAKMEKHFSTQEIPAGANLSLEKVSNQSFFFLISKKKKEALPEKPKQLASDST
jgi:hypothetical protein